MGILNDSSSREAQLVGVAIVDVLLTFADLGCVRGRFGVSDGTTELMHTSCVGVEASSSRGNSSKPDDPAADFFDPFPTLGSNALHMDLLALMVNDHRILDEYKIHVRLTIASWGSDANSLETSFIAYIPHETPPERYIGIATLGFVIFHESLEIGKDVIIVSRKVD